MRNLPFTLLLCVPLCAQADHVLSSPLGYDGTEGNGDFDTVLASQPVATYQQIDRTWRGSPGTLTTSLFRRDGILPDNLAYTSRTLEMELVMGTGNIDTATASMGTNYVGPPVTVFAKKNVNLFGWELQPLFPPAPFDNLIQWDQPWIYTGERDLLWEVRVTQNSGYPYSQPNNYPFDLHDPSITAAPGLETGVGCVATGQSQPFRLAATAFNHQTKFRLRLSGAFAPAGAPVVGHLDSSDPGLSLPGLCAVVHAIPLVVLPLGLADARGTVTPPDLDNIPWDQNLVGKTFYLQAAALDAGQQGIPVALSQGVAQTIPANAPKAPFVHVYSYTANGQTVVSGPNPGGVVGGFLHAAG